MKWSVHSKKGKCTREAADKHKFILKFIENHLKNSKKYIAQYRCLQLYEA